MENLGTEIAENEEETTDIEKREKEAVELGEVDFSDEELDEGVDDEVTPDTDSEEKPIVIDGQEYTTDQIRDLLSKKAEPKSEVKEDKDVKEDKSDKMAKIKDLKERVKGDAEMSELVDLLGNTVGEVDQIAQMKKELEDRRAAEEARLTLAKSRERVSKEMGIDLPDLDDPDVRAFFTKELPVMDPFKMYALARNIKPKKEIYTPPNLEDRSEGEGRKSGEAEQIEEFARKLGAKNPKNAVKGYKG